MDIEEPVAGRYASAFHFHAALTSVLGPTLIRDEAVQVREPREKRLLATPGMMDSLHRESLPLDGVRGLIQQRDGYRHLGVCKDLIPTRLLVLKPASHALAVGRPRRMGGVVGKVA